VSAFMRRRVAQEAYPWPLAEAASRQTATSGRNHVQMPEFSDRVLLLQPVAADFKTCGSTSSE